VSAEADSSGMLINKHVSYLSTVFVFIFIENYFSDAIINSPGCKNCGNFCTSAMHLPLCILHSFEHIDESWSS